MIGLPVLIALGPCLISAMAALALIVVALGFSRTGHALVWAIAFAMSTLQWGLMAAQGAWSDRPLHTGLAVNLLGLAAVVVLAEGFRLRRWPRRGRGTLLLCGGVGLAALIATAWTPAAPLRAAITPLLSACLLLWAAGTVVRPAAPPSASEIVVAAVLIAVVLVDVAGAALAAGEQLRVVPDHRLYTGLYMTAAVPASAGLALASLILIAHDYAAELRRLLHTDPLTGILNREGFDHVAQAAFGRSRQRRLALALADIDHFKQVNDRHGHAAGDAALAGVAERLARGIGRDGTVARIGGEEFAMLLPGLDGAAALRRVEALRRRLRPGAARDPAPSSAASSSAPSPTVSFGVAERQPGESLASLIERADAALYRSKREGRDRCTLASAEAATGAPAEAAAGAGPA